MISAESRELIRRAELLYEQRLKTELEASHCDYFVAIEPDSGEYFLGLTMGEAAAAARVVHPDRRTHIMRVGHRTAIHMGSLAL
jgi:hypothetical protein